MNLKVEEYEIDFEDKLKRRIKDLWENETDQIDEEDLEAPNNYEKVI